MNNPYESESVVGEDDGIASGSNQWHVNIEVNPRDPIISVLSQPNQLESRGKTLQQQHKLARKRGRQSDKHSVRVRNRVRRVPV